jgi:hypothetical protein
MTNDEINELRDKLNNATKKILGVSFEELRLATEPEEFRDWTTKLIVAGFRELTPCDDYEADVIVETARAGAREIVKLTKRCAELKRKLEELRKPI